MHTKTVIIILLILVLSACGGGGDTNVSPQGPGNKVSGTAGLAGTTMKLTGQPSSNLVAVVVVALNQINKETRSVVGGAFEFTDIPNGEYTIIPELEGYTFSPPLYNFKVVGENYPRLDFVATPTP